MEISSKMSDSVLILSICNTKRDEFKTRATGTAERNIDTEQHVQGDPFSIQAECSEHNLDMSTGGPFQDSCKHHLLTLLTNHKGNL